MDPISSFVIWLYLDIPEDDVVGMQQVRKNHTGTDFVSSNPWLSMIFNALIGSYYREIEEGWPLMEAIMHYERESAF